MGRLGMRRPGHYCRAHCLRLLWPQACAPAARNCQRIAWAKGIPRRARGGAARPSLPFRHRIWGGCCLFCSEPRYSFLIQNTVISGALYGVAVYFFMERIGVALSASVNPPFFFELWIIRAV